MASSPRIDELRKKFEENPRRYFAPLANEYRKSGEIEQAIAICREYLPQQPGHMSGHIVFGQALFEAKQLDEAKTVFETALSLDPENLIALKHLGDITLAAGDKEAAKGWYKRVLEADPRNEETLAQLTLIEGGAKPAPAPATPAAAPVPAKTMPMPTVKPGPASSAPTVVMQAMRPLPKLPPAPVAPAPIQSMSTAATVPLQVPATPSAVSPTEEIKLEGLSHGADSHSKVVAGSSSVGPTLIMETPHGLAPVAAGEAPDVVPAVGLEATSVGSSEPPMDSFSLDGLETTSLSAPPPPPVATPEVGGIDLDFGAPAAPSAAPAEGAATVEIELDIPSAPTPVAPPVADVETMPSIDLDFAAPAAPVPQAPPPPLVAAAVPVDESGLVDLDIGFEVPAPPTPAATPDSPAPVAVVEDLVVAPTDISVQPREAEPIATPVELAIEPPAPAPESGPFVTETMAELYLQQGHREEALHVYRALLEQRPADAAIQTKIAELTGVVPVPEPVAPEPAPVVEATPHLPPLPPADGPTIRAVLMLVAMRRPGYRPDAADGNGATPLASADAVAASAAVPLRGSADSLGLLWNNEPPSPDEESAAQVLAVAFAELDDATHGHGALDLSGAAAAVVAARAAAAAATAGGAPEAPSSFSFDKFFSQRATAEHAAQRATPSAPGSPTESKEDVAQFTQWLEGLKQR